MNDFQQLGVIFLFFTAWPMLFTQQTTASPDCMGVQILSTQESLPPQTGGIKVSIESNGRVIDDHGCPVIPTDSTESFVIKIENIGNSAVTVSSVTLTYDDAVLTLKDFSWNTTASSTESSTTLILTPDEAVSIESEETEEIDFLITREAAGTTTIDIVDVARSEGATLEAIDQCIGGGSTPGVSFGSIDDQLEVSPLSFVLEQNYPNPFQDRTMIRFTLPEIMDIELSIFDLTGKQVKTFKAVSLSAGTHEFEFKSSGFPAGVYYYRLSSDRFISTQAMTMIK